MNNILLSNINVAKLFTVIGIVAVIAIILAALIVLVSKLIEFLLHKFESKTYYGVLGFIFASIIAIPVSSFSSIPFEFNIIQIVIGIIMAGIGSIVSYKLGGE